MPPGNRVPSGQHLQASGGNKQALIGLRDNRVEEIRTPNPDA